MPGTAIQGDRLKMGYVYRLQVIFNPLFCRTDYERQINKLIFGDGLFIRTGDGAVKNGIALSSKHDDYKIWTITLQPEIKFHDQSEVTAEDIKFSFDLYQKFELQAPKLYIVRYIRSVEVINTYTIRITLHEPLENFKNTIGLLPILPRNVYNPWLNYDKVHSLPFIKPVGIGSFSFNRGLGYQIHLNANTDYFRKKPHLNGIDIQLFDSYEELVNSFVQEKIDIIEVDDKNIYHKINQITDQVKFSWVKRNKLKLYYVNMNIQRRPFNEVNIRRALNQAINKNLLVERNLPDKSFVASNILTASSDFYFQSSQRYKYDPIKSNQTLESVGFSRQRNGKLFRNGRELKFELYFEKGSSFEESMVRLISISMGELGINVLPRPLSAAEIENRKVEGNYQAILSHFIYDPENTEQVPREFYYEELNKIGRFRNFNERRLNTVIERSEKTYKLNELLPNLQRIQYLYNEFAPCVFLIFEDKVYYAIHSRMENTKFVYRDNLQYQTKLTPKYEWYVPTSKQKY